jgi:hypothetical protein
VPDLHYPSIRTCSASLHVATVVNYTERASPPQPRKRSQLASERSAIRTLDRISRMHGQFPVCPSYDHRSHATSGYVGLSQLKKQKLEAAGSSGAVQALRMENDAPVAGPDAPTVNSKMVKLDIGTDWSRPTFGLPVIEPRSVAEPSRIAANISNCFADARNCPPSPLCSGQLQVAKRRREIPPAPSPR